MAVDARTLVGGGGQPIPQVVLEEARVVNMRSTSTNLPSLAPSPKPAQQALPVAVATLISDRHFIVTTGDTPTSHPIVSHSSETPKPLLLNLLLNSPEMLYSLFSPIINKYH